MFGLSDDSDENLGDVVVEDAADVTIESPEDVFIAPGAVEGAVRIVDVGDVFVEPSGKQQPDPHGDFAADSGEEVNIDGCEDVRVESGAVSGDLVIKHTHDDVFIQTTVGVELTDVEDVFIQTGGIEQGDSVRVTEAMDVWLRDSSVSADVTAESPEDILQKSDGAVARGVRVDDPNTEGPLHLVDTEDVLAETSAVDGEIVVADPDGVVEGASF